MEEVVGKAIADHWPPSYELPSHIKPHAHRFVLVTPAKDASWGGDGCGPRVWTVGVRRAAPSSRGVDAHTQLVRIYER